jgi:adenylate cyclase
VLASEVRTSAEKRVVTANITGALLLVAYLLLTGPPPRRGISWVATITGSVLICLVAIGGMAAIALPLSRRRFAADTAWITEKREPSPEERATVLRLPWTFGVYMFPYWVTAAVATAAFPGTTDLAHRIGTFVAITLGGVTTCALSFLFNEHAVRNLTAQALADAAPDQAGPISLRRRLLLAWALGSGIPLVGIAITPLIRSPDSPVPLTVPIVLLAAIGLCVGLAMTAGAARSIADPMERLRSSMHEVQRGDVDASVEVNDGGDIGMVQAGFNQMVAGLREREQLRDLFGRHVGEEVARAALEQGVSLGGEARNVSVFFVDLVGSSALARETSPDRVVALLNRFFAAVVHAAASEGGWVNKFEGDAALCVFGAPTEQPDHAGRALRAARALRDSLDGIEAGIGVSSGTVVAGNVGSEARYEYTVIGHPVNEASRLTDEAKRFEGRLLASAAAINAAPDEAANWESRGEVDLRGTGPTEVYEPR